MDVTEPTTPEEVVMSTLDDLLEEGDEIDTQVYADNVVIALRGAGYRILPPAPECPCGDHD